MGRAAIVDDDEFAQSVDICLRKTINIYVTPWIKSVGLVTVFDQAGAGGDDDIYGYISHVCQKFNVNDTINQLQKR